MSGPLTQVLMTLLEMPPPRKWWARITYYVLGVIVVCGAGYEGYETIQAVGWESLILPLVAMICLAVFFAVIWFKDPS
jgi:ATP/ADP translocase